MKYTIMFLALLLPGLVCFGQEKVKPEGQMKNYFFVMLKKGPDRNHDSATVAKIQQGHMANINKLAEEKKLIVAGPFLDNADWRGVFIFDGKSKEEVEEWVKSDPAVKSGRLSYEIHPWMTQVGTCFY